MHPDDRSLASLDSEQSRYDDNGGSGDSPNATDMVISAQTEDTKQQKKTSSVLNYQNQARTSHTRDVTLSKKAEAFEAVQTDGSSCFDRAKQRNQCNCTYKYEDGQKPTQSYSHAVGILMNQ
jgi:hypothetical protein